MPIEAVTLDFYNTLVFHRDGRGRGRTLVDYLERKGLRPAPWEHDVLYHVFGSHDRAYSPEAPRDERQAYYVDLAARVLERMRVEGSSELAAEHADALWRILGVSCFALFDDVVEALEALRARGLRLAVVSNWQSGLRHFCAELELAHYLDHVISSADLGVEKPDRRIFLEACRRLGVRPERTLHIGDSYRDDYIGARSAGLQAALLVRTGASRAEGTRTVRNLLHLADPVP